MSADVDRDDRLPFEVKGHSEIWRDHRSIHRLLRPPGQCINFMSPQLLIEWVCLEYFPRRSSLFFLFGGERVKLRPESFSREEFAHSVVVESVRCPDRRCVLLQHL